MRTLGAAILVALAATNTRADNGPVVKVTGGQIRDALLNKGGAVFKGIPYAQPPVLYLNVWTPEWPIRSRLPVMVWIPGGGNFAGGISAGNAEERR